MGEKRKSEKDKTHAWGMGAETGSDPHIMAIIWNRGETFEATGNKWLICDSLSKMRITQISLAAAIRILDRDTSPIEAQ